MKKHLVEVNFKEHSHYSLLAKNTTEQAAKLNIIPVGLNEIKQASQHYPLVWVKSSHTGQFKLVALFGFETGENVYCQSKLWHTIPSPLSLKNDPFYLGYNNKGAEQRFKQHLTRSVKTEHAKSTTDKIEKTPSYNPSNDVILCIDKNSASLDDNGKHNNSGLPFYQSNNQPSACLQNAQRTLATLTQGQALTDEFLSKIASLQLMQPLKLDITWQDNTQADISGLYTIDPLQLNLLKPAAHADLIAQGYVDTIELLNSSLAHIQRLVQLKNNLIEAHQEVLSL